MPEPEVTINTTSSSDEVIARVKAELTRSKREEDMASALNRIEADMAEVAGFLRQLRWWGPILIAVLLGDDALTEVIRARVVAPVSQQVPKGEDGSNVPVAALPREP